MGKFNSDKVTGIWREIGDSQLFARVSVIFCDCAICACRRKFG